MAPLKGRIGEGIKNSHPLTKQGWDTKYSTVPPWLRLAPSLIDAITGAPGRLFPTCGSEVVSSPAGLQSLFTNRLLSEHLSGAACLRRSLYGENIAQTRPKVNPCGGKSGNFPENTGEKVADKSGCVLKGTFRPFCNFFTICCVRKSLWSAYFGRIVYIIIFA